MSRTKRNIIPHLRRNILYRQPDHRTGKPYDWGKRQWSHQRYEAAVLRGDDGKIFTYKYRWTNPKDAIRTHGRKLLNEGLNDHYHQHLDDHAIDVFNGWIRDEEEDLRIQIEWEREEERLYELELAEFDV